MDRWSIKNETYQIDFPIPQELQESIDAVEEAIRNKDSLIDCYQDELYSTVNLCLHSLTREQADIIRKRYDL